MRQGWPRAGTVSILFTVYPQGLDWNPAHSKCLVYYRVSKQMDE